MKSKLRGQMLLVAATLGLTLVVGCGKLRERRASKAEAAEPAAGSETFSQALSPEESMDTPAAPLPSDLEGEPVSDATP